MEGIKLKRTSSLLILYLIALTLIWMVLLSSAVMTQTQMLVYLLSTLQAKAQRQKLLVAQRQLMAICKMNTFPSASGSTQQLKYILRR